MQRVPATAIKLAAQTVATTTPLVILPKAITLKQAQLGANLPMVIQLSTVILAVILSHVLPLVILLAVIDMVTIVICIVIVCLAVKALDYFD
jgi:hypothetical protein